MNSQLQPNQALSMRQEPVATNGKTILKNLKMIGHSYEYRSKLYAATAATITSTRTQRGRMKPNLVMLLVGLIVVNFLIPLVTSQEAITTISPPTTSDPTVDALNRSSSDQDMPIIHTQPAATNPPPAQTNAPPASTQSSEQQKVELSSGSVAQQVTSEQPQQTVAQATKAVPVLRPSLEEVASKLSRKHLNLEHENWRLKTTTSQVVMEQFSADDTGTSFDNDDAASLTETTDQVESLAASGPTVEAEQEIKVSAHHIVANSSVSQQQQQLQQQSADSSSVFRKPNDYLHIDVASGWAAKNKQHQSAGARRKKQGGAVFQQSYYEDNELYQCHQYLQHHSSPQSPATAGGSGGHISASPVVNAGLSRLASSQLLPCSCESRRRQFDSEPSSAAESTWLSCDNVQLMGSHFYTPPSSSDFTGAGGNSSSSSSDEGSGGGGSGGRVLLVTRFSQRDSGLQTLHAQKFHYLQLFHLKSIDLSNNRIRLIKMDAFHGLENKVEFLNLANNLLGDSRALANERLIFSSDELNRLRRLKWLSLHNNQINQLGPSVFYKPSQQAGPGGVLRGTTTNKDQHGPPPNTNPDGSIGGDQLFSGLSYLDLSENLLNFIPSESIYQLSELKTLRLAGNRIEQLNQFSKFPKSLRYLDLSANLIRTIRQCNLIDLPNLVELDLSHNQLSHLDKTAFVSASSSSLANNLVLAPPSDTSSAAANNGQDLSRAAASNSEAGDIRLHALASAAVGGPTGPTGENDGSAHSRRVRSVDDLEELLGTFGGDEDGLQSDGLSDNEGDDLDSGDSSIISAVVDRVTGSRAQQSDDSNAIQHLEQFNATLRLNLSHNLFDNVPGDSLLKFSNLQQLDLSYNRIRKLDSNYFCSIYNLVENLRHLDLSGNLLSITTSQTNGSSSSGGAQPALSSRQHLNKLFGCLLRLEKLLVSTNRLAVVVEQPTVEGGIGTGSSEQVPDQSVVGGDTQPVVATLQEEDYLDQFQISESNLTEQYVPLDGDRLTIKFGEGFGSRFLNTLDLSDNQLRSMPIIEQVVANPIVSLNMTTSSNVSHLHQSHLNQWINSRMYLEVLNLNYNSIERLEEQDFEHLFNLRHLYMDFNKLSALPVHLMRRFTSLDRLSLNGNLLSSISPLNELFERSARTLRLLNLANNRLSEWPQITKLIFAPVSADVSNQQSQRRILSVDSDSQQTPIGFSLEELNLEGNQFTSDNISALFDQLLYMKSLRVLNLRYNLLNRVKSEWFKYANRNLQSLQLTGNRINSIDLGSFAWNQVNELVQLSLDQNLLRELKRKTFDSLPKLRELNLANNLLHTINSEAFHQVSSLQILRLNNNKLTSWKCEYFSNLCNPTSGAINADLASLLGPVNQHQQPANEQQQQQQQPIPSPVSSLIELDLSHNSLSQLRANSIAVHTKLAKLNLSHNKLSFIPHDLFKATTLGSLTGRQILLVSSIRYLNLAHNHIQTIDNINFRPLKNLITLDLSHNELQTLGVDVILLDPKSIQQEQNNRRVIVSSNLTNLPSDDEMFATNRTDRQPRSSRFLPPATNWPALSKLRHLNVAHNQLTLVNQSLISELSPFALLNLNMSFNYLDSDSLPYGFYSKITAAASKSAPGAALTGGHSHAQDANSGNKQQQQPTANYDLVFTLKLESLDLSHNKLNEFPTNLLDNHYTSMEGCNLSHNRIQNLVANSNLMLQIKALNLESNPLTRESNELVLFEQRSVRHLNLAATRLFAIQQASVTSDQLHLMASNPQLKYRLVNQTSQLDLIRSISKPINAPYLRHLNLSSNQLVWLAANVFDKLHSLQTLDLSNNQLTRLHLLNNQLMHVSSSLEYLNLASNLFTSVDINDFGQLSKLRHLDLSNLLSLQKMNCKFLSKLGSLRTLKLFNYPQLRQNINNLLAATTSGRDSQDRMHRRQVNDLIMSSLGGHCFRDDAHGEHTVHNPATLWFDLEHLELELFNNFHSKHQQQQQLVGGGFKLHDELSQLLGPRLRHLTLYGLNLTSLADESLFGITNEELKLKISYTSMTQLPLRQLLQGPARRTKLQLDFRNNNIQSIDTRGLQLLDELQLNHQVLQRGDHSSLRLSSNPIRCDCQIRPLWLWLNQRWSSPLDLQQAASDEMSLDAPGLLTGGLSHNWLPKFKSISQTSDLKCYYPPKLRGKPTQHVNYNDLICRGPAQPIVSIGRQSRKRNETRPSDSYYITSSASSSPSAAAAASGGGDLSNEADDVLDEDDYLDFAESKPETLVRMTKFNRYPASFESNSSSLAALWSLVQERPTQGGEMPFQGRDLITDDGWQRGEQASGSSIEYSEPKQPPPLDGSLAINTNYNKHRPNIHQRHSHYDTLTPMGSSMMRGPHMRGPSGGSGVIGSQPFVGAVNRQHSLLSDIDVLILTVSSVAMTIMCFIIIIICLFRHKMDQSGKEQILEAQNQFLVKQAILMQQNGASAKMALNLDPLGGVVHHLGAQPPASDPSSQSSSRKSLNKLLMTSGEQPGVRGKIFVNRSNGVANLIEQQAAIASQLQQQQQQQQQQKQQAHTQILLPAMGGHTTLVPPPPPAATENFLMRSPTIRRMQGMATNASDWFKFTLRAYPPSVATANRRRKHLLMGSNLPAGSQLTTAQLAAASKFDKSSKLLPAALAAGCPLHAFRCVQRLREQRAGQPEEQCQHCVRLLAAVRQTEVSYAIGGAAASEESSSSSSNASSTVAPSRLAPQKQPQAEERQTTGEEATSSAQKVEAGSVRRAAQQVSASGDSQYKLTPKASRSQQQQQQPEKDVGYEKLPRFSLNSNVNATGQRHRDQARTRPLRTFGSKIQAATKAGSSSQGSAQPSDTSHIRSQIPSMDVEGRFAYQSDSNYDSPACNANSLQGSRPDTRTENRSSSLVESQDEMFILVHGSPPGSSRVSAKNLKKSDNSSDRLGQMSGEMRISDSLINEFNSMMNDECSHSSSPVAYGFMRSSPSATTLSSVATAQPNQAQPEAQHHQQNLSHAHSSANNTVSYANQSIIANNNNNNNYWVHRKEEINPVTSSTTADDQIIISRL